MTTFAWFVRGQRHAALATIAMAAVKSVYRKAGVNLVVATDDPLVADIDGARMIRTEPGQPLYVATLEARCQVLWAVRSPVWFIDTDVLVTKPFPDLWDHDLVLTWRDNVGGKLAGSENDGVADMMPYNGGVIGAGRQFRTLEFMLWMRERIRRMAPNLREWYGDQLALAAAAGRRPDSGEVMDTCTMQWDLVDRWPTIDICKIPGEIWNYTPASADEDISMRGALHFKGHSRELMSVFAERLGLNWPEEAAA